MLYRKPRDFYFGLCLFALSLGLLPGRNFAMRLLSYEAALQEMFGDATIAAEDRTLTPEETAAVKAKLDGSLVHFQKGAETKTVAEKLKYTFYFATRKQQKVGVAVIEDQPGKWGPVEFIIALDPATGKVLNLAVLSYEERRGRPIASRNFLDQFIGKGDSDLIRVRKDIRAVSGATISSEATCFAVKKVIALYGELYLKK